MVTLETAEQLILSSRPRGGLIRGPMFVLLGLSVLLGALAGDSNLPPNSWWTWLVPQVILIALAGIMYYSVRRQKELARYLQESVEAVQLKQWPQAWDTLNRLLRRPVPHPTARAESLLALAAVAEASDSFEVSQRIYEHMLEERQADPLQLHTARVGLGAAMLRTGQTTDAVGLINRLEREELPGSLKAHTELLALYRELTMGHAADRLDRAEERRGLFRRYMGSRAGYGYALLAAAFDVAGNTEKAARCWLDATMLLPASELVRRFGELKPLASKYIATKVPAGLTIGSGPAAEVKIEL
jgi:tetratricopeptide (TPR) repeat protein